jgi:hypothetical protein
MAMGKGQKGIDPQNTTMKTTWTPLKLRMNSGDESQMRKGQDYDYDYDKRNMSVVICETDIP